jgi:Zn-dependent peptidase ImmA (M78 family)
MVNPELEHIGSRIEVARTILGKSRPEVAADLEVSSKVYGGFERGESEKVFKHLDVIAETLCVKTDFFYQGPIRVILPSELSYRKRVLMKSPQSRHVQGMASLAADLTGLIERYVALPMVAVPYVPIESQDDIESAVWSIRNQLDMSDAPLRNAVALVESFGVLVFWVDADRTFDGVSFWNNDRPYILLNRNQRDGYRTRFTVLHELGHIISHRAFGDIDHRHEEERRRLDREADFFASSFLLPATSFGKRFPRFGSLYEISDDRSYWMASCAAMVRRAWQLKLIDEEHYRRLNVGISAKGWRRGEPNSPEPETSRVHRFFFDEAGEHGKTTFDLADSIGCPISWFREAFPQSEQYQTAFIFGDLDG